MLLYYTIKPYRKTNEPTLEEILYGIRTDYDIEIKDEFVTHEVDESYKIKIKSENAKNINKLIKQFFTAFPDFKTNKQKYYREFSIPKRKGGRRYLIEPNAELKTVQQVVLTTLQEQLHIYPHNSAYAFTKNRDAYLNAIQHVNNKCIVTIDLKDFFPSIKTDILQEQLRKNAILFNIEKEIPDFINNIVELATYKDALPQGSPLSPFLSNIVMTEFDYKLTKLMSEHEIDKYKYTRYADDMAFSSKAFGNCKKFVNDIDNLLKTCYHNSIQINKEKTKFIKNTNRCYITGVKLNKDYNATYGHENKKVLKLQLFNLFIAQMNNTLQIEEAREVLGRFAYMKRIEPDYANYLERKLLQKFGSPCKTLAKHFL